MLIRVLRQIAPVTKYSVALVDTFRLIHFLLYGLEACSINSSDYRSLEHTVTVACMKVFKTNCVTVVNECQEAFGVNTVRRQTIKRKIIFSLNV